MKSLIPHTLPPWGALTGMAVDGDTEVGRMLWSMPNYCKCENTLYACQFCVPLGK